MFPSSSTSFLFARMTVSASAWNNLKSGGEIKLFMEQYEKNRDSKLFQALADTVMRANWKEEEEGNMSDVIKEIFADQFHKCEAEARAQGEAEGRAEGAASKMIEQIMKKYKKGCSVAETADMLEENPSVIEQIYDIFSARHNPVRSAEVYHKSAQ